MFISWQTFEVLQITTYSSVDLIVYLLNNGLEYVLPERWCQDPNENYFGRQRSMGRWSDNPTVSQFGYNDNTIRRMKTIRPIRHGNSRDNSELFTVSDEPMLCREKPTKLTKC